MNAELESTLGQVRFLERARLFATAAHAAVGQKRKYTFEDYIVHPLEVARLVDEAGGTTPMIAAAYLHDVLEDTQVTEFTLRREFGDATTDLVVWLTKVEVPGNRAVRKAAELKRLDKAPAEAQTIKYADLISNTPSIVKYDPVFAKTYLQEKLDLLAELRDGDPGLKKLAFELVWEVWPNGGNVGDAKNA